MNSTRIVAWSALALALGALVLPGVAESIAAKQLPGPSLKPRKFGVLRLNAKKKFPASVLPPEVFDRCSPETVKIGTVCMMTSPYPLEKDEIGKADFFFATRKCASLGGYLPTAAQLIGAASRVKLAGRVDDNEVTASTDLDATDGLKDRREMSASLTTIASGGRAAGSQGVSDIARGDPKAGEPDPSPLPADPSPETLHYITVYDNGNLGGFAGGKPVGQPENFRCAFNLAQGKAGHLG
ncbi:MAG TPA: hypothetical protein VF729_03565 [Solirubrobacterales bacterium]